MPAPAATPNAPASHQWVPGRSSANERTGDCCVRRPIAISPIMIGRQISAMQAR